jgi:hypothetical protein
MVMKNSEFIPVKIDQFLSNQDVSIIKDIIPVYDTNLQNPLKNFDIHQSGLHQYHIQEPELYSIFNKAIEKQFNRKVKELGLFFGRYLKVNNKNPELHPHLDNYNPGSFHGLTFTYIVDSSIKWDVGVQETLLDTNTNDFILMSGSTHVHWRSKIMFADNDYYDIIVGHFTFEDSETDIVPENFKEIMQIERNKYWRFWDDSKQS